MTLGLSTFALGGALTMVAASGCSRAASRATQARIAQAYYDKATNKAKAIRDIIGGDAAGTGTIRRLLAQSGYSP